MALPPGIVFLIKAVPPLLYPAAIAYGCLRVFENVKEVNLPLWVPVLVVLAANPLLCMTQSVIEDHRRGRQAAAMGAVIAPIVPSKTPWGLDNLAIIVTTEPEHVKAILATKFEDFDKGPVVNDAFYSLLGNGVFSIDGDMWKFHRFMTRPFFNKERISDFANFNRHADAILRQAKARIAEGFPVDFQDMVARFTLDSATEYLFGYDVNSTGAGLAYPEGSTASNAAYFLNHPSNRFVKAFGMGQDFTAARVQVGTAWRLIESWKDKVRPLRAVVDDYIRDLLEAAAVEKSDVDATKRPSDYKPKEGDNLLQHLVNFTQDRSILADELINLLVAGRDTTSGTLSFGIYKLAEYPEIAEKLRAEILEKVGPTRSPTYDDIKDMKYLRAFLNETLRLYPLVPVNARQGLVIMALASPAYSIFAGRLTRIRCFHRRMLRSRPFLCLYSVYLMHRRTDLWGPDAGKFDPDRFIDERLGKYLTHNPYIFVPFNAGPRICLGQQFAYNEMSFFLVKLLQNFDSFSLATDVQPRDSIRAPTAADTPGSEIEKRIFGVHLTMYFKSGLWVRMQEAPPVQSV
ncbi:cytochrome P450 [Schizophyllum commune H4-8]|uniref:cytochrome P450 n=1 Tax=Schizophyllum commune (strain H4-8 / FGSC 9210) TaxID=578458 RepID=UPI0021605340|nr:cytochrome P450 [Schizophyllum commune H4-8]KAI5888709.1 cytochrome P450 [Schizophyllum commune H4-8]